MFAVNMQALKGRLKITQLEKLHFIIVNESKLTQGELFYFFHFMRVAPNATKWFYMAHLSNNEQFL